MEENVCSNYKQMIFTELTENFVKSWKHISNDEIFKALEFVNKERNVFADGSRRSTDLVQHRIKFN